MTSDANIEIRCQCGTLRGVARGLSPQTGNRAVCYCLDCRAFPLVLGVGDRILDEDGGTDLFQTSAARIAFTDGVEQLACLRLTPKGPFRWYARCCDSPIGNTPTTSAVPFVGLLVDCLASASPDTSLDDALGPVRTRVFGRFAKRDVSHTGASSGPGLAMALRLLPMMLRSRLRGDHRRGAFFDGETGAPRATPRVVDAEERGEAERTAEA